MLPLASTSTAQLPGFRSSRPKRAAAALRQAKTRASQLRDRGKGKARDTSGDDYDDNEGGDYAPGQGQVRRRKVRRPARDKGKKRAREEDDEEEIEAALERIEEKRARKRARKDEKRAEQLAQARAREAAEDSAPAVELQRAKGKAKKRVQFDAPASDTDGGGGASVRGPAGGSGEDDDDDEGTPELALEDVDLADPMQLPVAERRRGRRFWRALEHGVYRSALHDVAENEAELGRALVQWEALRRTRAAQEAEEQAVLDAERAVREASRASAASLERANKRRRAVYGSRSFNPHRSLLPYPALHGLGDDDADEPRRQPQFDDAGHEVLPLPSSLALARMARWPQHTSILSKARLSTSSADLEDAVLASYERAQRRSQDGPTLPRLQPAAPRSAYGPGAPFGSSERESSDDDVDVLEDPLADVHEPVESSDAPPALTAIPPLLSSILLRLTDFIPKAPLPALDVRSVKKRNEQMAKDDRKRGVDRDATAPGWEEVVAVARESGVSEHIVAQLEEKLVALFGTSTRPPIELPPKGNPTVLALKSKRKASKAGAGTAMEEDADMDRAENRLSRRKDRRRWGASELTEEAG